MANEENEENWDLKLRQDTEQEFFTELALHEAERWIQAVTRKKFQYADDFRKSLENGILLCELLNNLKPGSVKRINKLPTPLAGLDNINVFLNVCKKKFGLKDSQLFDPCDLEDLSQRAISQSERSLQQEVERRNTNVAIAIYWLGRTVDSSCNSPQLDQSAFAALVNIHRKDILSDKQLHHDSLECSGYSSAYSSHDGKDGHRDSVERKHNPDSSFDSFGSYGHSRESSLTEENNMPVGSDIRRYGSTSSLNRSGELRLSSNLDMSYDGFNQSTPDLSNAHTRTSSMDSYEDSHGSHSRQSSDSVDIPTRTLKSRRVSQSEDPLKFIKLKPSKELAKQAIEQITMVQEERLVRKTEVRDEEDWQSNLSSWKNRRRRVSAATYERVEGTDDLIKDEEEKKKTKTYDQIRNEREKRKSTGQLNFYPVEDDEDLSWEVKTPSRQSTAITEAISRIETPKTESEPKRAPKLSSKYRSKSMGSTLPRSDIAPWAEDDEDNKSDKSNSVNIRKTFDENHNAEKPPIKNESAKRLSNKFSNIMKSFESREEETTTVYEKPRKTFEFSVDSKSERFKDSKVLDTARSTLQSKKKPEPANTRNYVEKNIKIKQKPHNAKGFGITVVGGQDKKQPVIIDKVNIGSAADVCEVMAKDEIISINNRDIGIMTQAMVRKVIDDASRKGELELCVRRCRNTDESDPDEEDDDEAFHPSPTHNSTQEPENVFSTKSSFEPSRTSSRNVDTSITQETTWSRSSYQSSPSSRRRESPSTKEPSQESRSTGEASQFSRKTESPVQESPRWSRSTNEFSARARPSHEGNKTFSPPIHDVITTTTSDVTESYRSRETIKPNTTMSPPVDHGRQLDNDFHDLGEEEVEEEEEEEEETTSIMSELDREKQWIMEQMAGAHNSINDEKNTEQEEEEEVEEEIIPQMKKTVESTYQRSFTSYEKTEEPVNKTEEVPVHQYTFPVSERIEEEKPTITVHRSRQQEEETTTTQIREIPITLRNKPEIKHIELQSQAEHRHDRNNDLSPSQASAGFGPPEILRRWQRPRPRSQYSSSSSLSDEKRLSASIDSPSSSPRFPEDDFSQNHVNGSKNEAVIGQPVTLEIRPEHPVRQTFNMSAPTPQNYNTPNLVIDPRNKADNSGVSLPQYNFHFNIGDKNSKENGQVQYDLEVERERIRQEEKERAELEKRQWEEEEQKRFNEKEARLREEEEKLRREKQEIKELKASMEREKIELSKKHANDNRNDDQYNSQNGNSFSSDKFNRTRQENNPHFFTSADSNSRPRSLDTSSSWRPHREEIPQRENLSREDMLLMNRSAKPFSRRPENEQSHDTNDHHVSHDMSKEDIHSVNYTPKPKIRNSKDWIQNSDSGSKHSSRSESPNEHWLVEEAERRRKSGRTSNFQSGPIKPKSDIISNRWQENRYSQPPRSSSPQNTRSYEFKQFSARPQKKLNQTLPANFNMGNIKPKQQPPVPPKPNRTLHDLSSSVSSSTRSSSNLSSPVSPSSPKSHAEQVVAVSGKQLCSHCSQELGFGAAMVIESLGLYYHVQCFKCCVCHSTLGNGSQGADVRVRVNKLHCRNCYSNDEAGLKFSKV